MNMCLARVAAVHSTSRTVDLVLSHNGQRIAGAQVVGNVSSDSGSWDVPDVPKPTSEASPDALSETGRNLVAVCGFIADRPVVLGFLPPLGGQMSFTEPNRTIHRHASGSYSTVSPDGSIELFHAAGAYVRIGTGAHEDLASISAGQNWQIPAGAPEAEITIETAGATITIPPNGVLTIACTSEVHLTCPKLVQNGDLAVNGAITATGEVTAKAATGSSVTLSQHRGHSGSAPPTPDT